MLAIALRFTAILLLLASANAFASSQERLVECNYCSSYSQYTAVATGQGYGLPSGIHRVIVVNVSDARAWNFQISVTLPDPFTNPGFYDPVISIVSAVPESTELRETLLDFKEAGLTSIYQDIEFVVDLSQDPEVMSECSSPMQGACAAVSNALRTTAPANLWIEGLSRRGVLATIWDYFFEEIEDKLVFLVIFPDGSVEAWVYITSFSAQAAFYPVANTAVTPTGQPDPDNPDQDLSGLDDILGSGTTFIFDSLPTIPLRGGQGGCVEVEVTRNGADSVVTFTYSSTGC